MNFSLKITDSYIILAAYRNHKFERLMVFYYIVPLKLKRMEAIEKIVQFDEEGNTTLKLGKHFSKKNAKIVVLIKDDEITENEWLSFAMRGGLSIF